MASRPSTTPCGAPVVPLVYRISADPEALPEPLRRLESVPPRARTGLYRERVADGDATALVIYTSGTTGMPKGVQIPRRAISSNLDALAEAWAWTERDRLAHALPAHGFAIDAVCVTAFRTTRGLGVVARAAGGASPGSGSP